MMNGSVVILLKDYKEVTEKENTKRCREKDEAKMRNEEREKKVSNKKSKDQLNQVVTAKNAASITV